MEEKISRALDAIHQNLVMIGKMVSVMQQGYAWQYDTAYCYYVPGYMALPYVERQLELRKSGEAIRKDLEGQTVHFHTGDYVPDAIGAEYISKVNMGE